MMVGGTGFGGQLDPSDLNHVLAGHHPFRRGRNPSSTASLLQAIEKRTQKTYRYGIGLVCIGATLNWLGFAQGNSYIDPLRYLGVACVISGSFCVCLAMCRWLGRPISLSGRLRSFEEDSLSGRSSGEVHVINVAVPMYRNVNEPPLEEYRPTKPPDYDIVTRTEPLPPPYDEAIKLHPGTLSLSTVIQMEMESKEEIQGSLASPTNSHSPSHLELSSPGPGSSPPPPYHYPGVKPSLSISDAVSDLDLSSLPDPS